MEFVGLASKLRNIFGDIEIFGFQFSGRKKINVKGEPTSIILKKLYWV
jgi:hypothetical protein